MWRIVTRSDSGRMEAYPIITVKIRTDNVSVTRTTRADGRFMTGHRLAGRPDYRCCSRGPGCCRSDEEQSGYRSFRTFLSRLDRITSTFLYKDYRIRLVDVPSLV